MWKIENGKLKATPISSIFDLIVLGACVFFGAASFKNHSWFWGAVWAGLSLLLIKGICQYWAWNPTEKDESQDKTQQLRKKWKGES